VRLVGHAVVGVGLACGWQFLDGRVRAVAQAVQCTVRQEDHVTGVQSHRLAGRRDEPAGAFHHDVEAGAGIRAEAMAPGAAPPRARELRATHAHGGDDIGEDVHNITLAV
jgi:hypothetical protein